MTGLQKFGYFTMGAGFGVFVATLLYERELGKAVGEIEEYVPSEPEGYSDTDGDEQTDRISTAMFVGEVNHISKKIEDLEENSRKRREEFDALRNERTRKGADYASMYLKGEEKLNDILNENLDVPEEPDDIPPDDDVEPDSLFERTAMDDLILERVEEDIEVYLGENPQDFITLIFFAGDETLCDDREQLISNPEEVVGSVAISRLVDGGPGAEEGTIFVRNRRTMLNYEVVLDDGKYSETVLGIFESRLDKGDGGDVDNR